MSRHSRVTLALLLVVILLFFLSASFFILHPGQNALRMAMGRVVAVDSQPGLYFHWPFVQQVHVIDTRLRSQSTKSTAIVVKGGQDLLVNTYVEWQVDDPQRFYQRGLNTALAEGQVADAVDAALARQIDALQGVTPDFAKLAAWSKVIRDQAGDTLASSGIRVRAVHVLELGLTADAQKTSYDAEKAHLQSELKDVELTAKGQADDIRAKGEKDRQQILADAYEQSQTLLGKAQGEAAAIYAQAYGKDPQFYAFSRSLQVLRDGLKAGDVLVIPEDSPLMHYLHPGRESGHP